MQRNEPCACGSGKKYKNCCYLKDNKVIKHGLNYISADSYFIRAKENKNCYMHYEGDNPDNPKQEVVYRLNEGVKNAAIWHKDQAQNFIIMSGYDNLEIVKVFDVLDNDGTLN